MGLRGVANAEVADTPATARSHFDRAVAAFEQRRFAEAAKEFRAAYDLSPTYVVLYNIGQVSAALGQAVESVDAFQAYLDQGGSTISAERRAAVLTELEKQQALIGTLIVRAKPDNAVLHIDGKLVGKTPIAAPIRLTAGKHNIVILLEGFEAQSREMRINAGAQTELEFALQSAKSAAASGTLPNAAVAVLGPGSSQSTVPASTIVNVQVPPQAAPTLSTHQQSAGYVLAGLGGVVVGVGTYIAASALGDANDAKNRGEAGAYTEAKTRNYWGWGSIAAGAIVGTTGIVLVFTAPRSSTSGAVQLRTFSDGHAHGISASAFW